MLSRAQNAMEYFLPIFSARGAPNTAPITQPIQICYTISMLSIETNTEDAVFREGGKTYQSDHKTSADIIEDIRICAGMIRGKTPFEVIHSHETRNCGYIVKDGKQTYQA